MAVEMPRKSGIETIGDVPWGTHICQFYKTPEESFALLSSYFKAGLENNEYCFWVVPTREKIEVARRELRNVVKDLDMYLAKGQIEILSADQWYTRDGAFTAKAVLDGWVLKVNQALKMGFDGLRLSGDCSWVTRDDWDSFADYEVKAGDLLDRSKAVAICCYSLDCCDAPGVIDVVSRHHLALIRQEGRWKTIENAERKKAIEAARAIEERYRRTAENIPVAIYSALPDERPTTVVVSDRILDLTGYPARDFLEKPELFREIVLEDDRDMVKEKLKEQREKKTPLKMEYRIRTPDGRIKWMKDESRPALDEKGEIVRIDGFVEDLTDRKEMEQALVYSEERYKLAQKVANIGSWDWDITTGKLVWSEAIESLFGFKRGEFAGTYAAFLQCVHPEDRTHLEERVRACIEKGERYDIEHRIVWPDGSIHWMSETGGVIRDKEGKAIRMLGIVKDVTKSRMNEERIRELNRNLEHRTFELAASNRELEAFCYSVSHDLRAPLRRIDGFSQILVEDFAKDLGNGAKAYIDKIRKSARNMDRLIDDLLRLSRITTAQASKEKVDLSRIAQSVADKLRESEPGRKVHFSIKETEPVLGDKNLLQIAIQNMLENAWKFTAKNEHAKIEFGAEDRNGERAYFVRDNGVGFDMSRASELFEPFRRIHSNEEFPGTGIGLAIVSRIVRRHGGRVWAEGQVDKGATFYFTLSGGMPDGPKAAPAMN